MSAYLQCPDTQIKTLSDVLDLIWLNNMLDVKNGYFGGGGNIKSVMLLWLPICVDVIIFLTIVVY